MGCLYCKQTTCRRPTPLTAKVGLALPWCLSEYLRRIVKSKLPFLVLIRMRVAALPLATDTGLSCQWAYESIISQSCSCPCVLARNTTSNALSTPGFGVRSLFGFPQKQTTGIRGDVSTIELAHHFSSSKCVKFKLGWSTLCFHKAVSFTWPKLFLSNFLCHKVTAFSSLLVRNAGHCGSPAGSPPPDASHFFWHSGTLRSSMMPLGERYE